MVHAVIVWPETKVIRTTCNLLCELTIQMPIALIALSTSWIGPEAGVDFWLRWQLTLAAVFLKCKTLHYRFFGRVLSFEQKSSQPLIPWGNTISDNKNRSLGAS
jgi:hypothetical protein